MPSKLSGFLNIRGKIPEIRAKDRAIADVLDQIQIFCDGVNGVLSDLGVSDRRLALFVDPSGAVNISGQSVRLTGKLFASGDTSRLTNALRTPTSAADTGELGDWCIDGSFLYVCIDRNVWRRTAHATF